MGSFFSIPSIHNLVTVKLTDTNYLVWSFQVKPFLVGQNLWRFVDGSHPAPPEYLETNPGPPKVLNPDYLVWLRTDQTLLSLLTATLSEPILGMVVGLTTSMEVWNSLARHFSQQSVANASALRVRLLSLTRDNRSISDYLLHAKSLSDTLTSIGHPVSNEDLVTSVLRGLGPGYEMIVTATLHFPPLPSFPDLRARLLSFEAQTITPTVAAPLQTAFITQQAPFPSGSQFPPPSRQGSHSGNRGSNHYRNKNRGRYSNSRGILPTPGTPASICQLCSSPAHVAPQCPRWCTRPTANSLHSAFAGLQLTQPTGSPTSQPSSASPPGFLQRSPQPYFGYQPASVQDPNWYPDTGATHHMTGDPRPLQNCAPYTGSDSVYLGNGTSLPITYTGNMSLPMGSSLLTLNNVYHVPAMSKNLLSVAQFTKDNNVRFSFDATHFYIHDLKSGALLFQGQCRDGLYPLSSVRPIPQAFTASSLPSTLWHSRLGHPSHKVLSYLGSHKFLSSDFRVSKTFCKGCALGKSTHLSFSLSNKISSHAPFDLVHSDVWQSSVPSVSGFKYYVLYTDDYTRYSWLYPMRRKSEVLTHFQTFLAFIKTHFAGSLKNLQSDGGTEYVNIPTSTLCNSLGIHHRLSCPHTPEQNGLAERKHRHISEMARTLLLSGHVPLNLWVEAVSTAVYLINRLPTPILQWDSPFSRLFGYSPCYSDLRVFGCACYPHLGAYVTNKLLPRSIECVFLGYSARHKGYRCLDPDTGRVYISRHVRFDETSFPYASRGSPTTSDIAIVPVLPPAATCQCPHNSPTTQIPHSLPTASVSPTVPPPGHIEPLPLHYQRRQLTMTTPLDLPSDSQSVPSSLPAAADPDFDGYSSDPSSSTPAQPLHPMVTRLRDGIRRALVRTDGTVRYPLPRALTAQLSSSSEEPTCFSQAMRFPEWRSAMADEFNALLKNQTWTLVPPSSHQNTVGCKWVFKVKRLADGTIERHKARLVAKGFHQQHGLDYDETFSPVVKPTTIRTVLSLAVSSGWSLRQLDVKNAFLHGFLKETVFMTQPPGFVDPQHPHHVCQLQKAIYGLKQAPRAWFQRFSSFLLQYGFTQSRVDHSMFVFRHSSQVMILLLYVDDIILTGSDISLLSTFISTLGAEFETKDLGPLHYFLGIEVTSLLSGIHLSQTRYTVDLLHRSSMAECKPCSTPVCAKTQLSAHESDPLSDLTEYRRLVGSLQYLTLTRPDIAFAVHHVAQFMSAPRSSHLTAVKRILRYLKGTIGLGIAFRPSSGPLNLYAFSDADWAGCPDTRRSTSGYCVFLGPNLISWSAKKQPTVSRSSAESEYRSLAQVCAETVWIHYLLRELHIPQSAPITLYCDNLSTTYMASNPVFHARTKHIELDYHFIRELVLAGTHRVQFVPSVDQTADLFTKGLHKQRFELLRSKLVLHRPSGLRGSIKHP